MTGSCQKTEAIARVETSYLQRQLPELIKKGADHFSHLRETGAHSVQLCKIGIYNSRFVPQMGAFMSYDILLLLSSEGFSLIKLTSAPIADTFLYFIKSAFD